MRTVLACVAVAVISIMLVKGDLSCHVSPNTWDHLRGVVSDAWRAGDAIVHPVYTDEDDDVNEPRPNGRTGANDPVPLRRSL